MKLKYTFETVDMVDEIIAVPVGDGAEKVHGVVKLDKSALEIFECLYQDTSIEMIVNYLASKYDDTPEVLTEYVGKTIDTLRRADLIDE